MAVILNGMILLPRGHLTMSGDIFVVTARGQGTTGI